MSGEVRDYDEAVDVPEPTMATRLLESEMLESHSQACMSGENSLA